MFIVRSYISVVYIEGVKIFIKYCIFIVSIEEMKKSVRLQGAQVWSLVRELNPTQHAAEKERKDTYLLWVFSFFPKTLNFLFCIEV